MISPLFFTRATILTVAILCCAISWSWAQPYPPLEPDALIGREFSSRIAQTGAMAVREAGYPCDTISAFALKSPYNATVFSLKCDEFRHSYVIENRGGRGVITVDD